MCFYLSIGCYAVSLVLWHDDLIQKASVGENHKWRPPSYWDWVRSGALYQFLGFLDREVLTSGLYEVGVLQRPATGRAEYRSEGPKRFRDLQTCNGPPVQVAVVGGGISGLVAAHTFLESNEARKCTPSNSAPANGAPLYNVTLFEGADRIGGHTWTVQFPITNLTTSLGNHQTGEKEDSFANCVNRHVSAGCTCGSQNTCRNCSHYPVDVAYAWTPLIPRYQILRRLYRKIGVHFQGPLANNVKVFKGRFQSITAEAEKSHDHECTRLLSILHGIRDSGAENKWNTRLWLHLTSLRSFWKMHALSEDFFMERVYPLIRFIVVSGSKAKILDAPAIAGLHMFLSGWTSCYKTGLHGRNWYNVRHGVEDELRKFLALASFQNAQKDGLFRLLSGTRVVKNGIKAPGREGKTEETKRVVQWQARRAPIESFAFDAVVLAVDPTDALDVLEDAPSWLRRVTTEEIQVAVHSDERVFGYGARYSPIPGSSSAKEEPMNTAYVIPESLYGSDQTEASKGNLRCGSLSVYWDSIHGEIATPRPILTYGAECWDTMLDLQGGAGESRNKFRGEVFRTTFRHVHYPDVPTFLLKKDGLTRLHNSEDASLIFAGSWSQWGFDHNGAITAGYKAAYNLGAKPDKDVFFATANKYADYPGWDEEAKCSEGCLRSQGESFTYSSVCSL